MIENNFSRIFQAYFLNTWLYLSNLPEYIQSLLYPDMLKILYVVHINNSSDNCVINSYSKAFHFGAFSFLLTTNAQWTLRQSIYFMMKTSIFFLSFLLKSASHNKWQLRYHILSITTMVLFNYLIFTGVLLEEFLLEMEVLFASI